MSGPWHVYAILGQDPGEVRLRGLGGAPVQAVRGGAVWALASERPEHGPSAADPLEHHRVIEGALERWPLLPARFAAPLGLEALVRRLERDAQAHLAALERVRGAREFAIRAELGGVTPGPRANAASGRAYLEARRAETTANARLLECCGWLCGRLAPFALEFAHRYPEPTLYRGAALVAEGQIEEFRRAFALALEALRAKK